MAVRTPLYVNGDNDLQEMTSAMIDEIIAMVAYQYGQNPSVTLSRVSSGGSLGTITDTRKKAGAYSTRAGDGTSGDDGAAEFPPESSTAEPGTVTVNHAKIDQTVASPTQPADTSSIAFPAYQTSGDIQAMSYADMQDTFIHPAITLLAGTAGTNAEAGTYFISTQSSSITGNSAPNANSTIVSGSAVYTDTRANTSAYTASGIPETLDQPTTITSYYLHVYASSAVPTYTAPVYVRSDNNIQTYTTSAFNTLLQNFVRYEAAQNSGTTIAYSYTSGSNRGTGMANTILNGSGNYQTRKVNANDYRAQEFPNGSAVTSATHRLKISLT